jgi:hypothetical protein
VDLPSIVITLRWLDAGTSPPEEGTMSHDKIKAAARRRMTATGEPYAAARRQAIDEHNATRSTSAVSAEDIRAAAEVHRELGPAYSDAVVASFIDKVDRAIAARAEARLADQARPAPAKPKRRSQQLLIRRVARDALVAGAGALVAIGAIGLHGITRPHTGPPVSRLAVGPCATRAGSSSPCMVPPNAELRYLVTVGGKITMVVVSQSHHTRR